MFSGASSLTIRFSTSLRDAIIIQSKGPSPVLTEPHKPGVSTSVTRTQSKLNGEKFYFSPFAPHTSQAMSNMQQDGRACVKFSKGIFYILIILMKLLNTSSDFSVHVAWGFYDSLFGHSDFSSLHKDTSLRSETEDSCEQSVQ